MSKIKSTIKLESTSMFPTVNLSKVNTNMIEGGSTTWSTAKIGNELFLTPPLTTTKFTAKGATIHAQSPSSNTRAISLYTTKELDNWFSNLMQNGPTAIPTIPTPFAILKPGDTIFTQLPAESLGVIALIEGAVDNFFGYGPTIFDVTATESATLNYFIGDRGGEIGKSALILTNYSNGEYSSYQYQIMDVETGKLSERIELNTPDADWYQDTIIPVQNKGYVIQFNSSSDYNYKKVFFVNTRGELQNETIDDVDTNYRFLEGRGIAYNWVGGSSTIFRIFNGETVTQYTIPSTSWNYNSYWDESTENAAISLAVYNWEGNSGLTKTIILSKGEYYVTHTDDNGSSNELIDIYTQSFGDTFLQVVYNYSGAKADRFEIWNSKGTLLKTVDVSSFNVNIDSVYAYGTGRWVIITRATASGGDNNWKFFAYDPFKNKVHGEDGSWVSNYSTHPNLIVYSDNKRLYYGLGTNTDNEHTNYDHESIAIATYSTNDFDSSKFLNQRSYYLKVSTLFPNAVQPYNYDLANNSSNFYWRATEGIGDSGIYPNDKSIRIHTGVSRSAGSLIANTIQPGGVAVRSVTIANLDLIQSNANTNFNNNNDGIVYNPFGEYGFYAYYNPSSNRTSFKVLSASGLVVDTLNVIGDHTYIGFWRARYGVLLIRTWEGTLRNWYFNQTTKKFVEIPEFYSSRSYPYMTYEKNVNDGQMILYAAVGDYVRVLTKSSLSPKIEVPTDIDYFNLNFEIGETYIFAYLKDANRDDYVTLLVYNFKGELVNRIETQYDYEDEYNVVGDRFLLYLYSDTTSAPDAWVLATPTSVEYLYIDSDQWRSINDIYWWD